MSVHRLFDRDDAYHDACVDILKSIRQPLVTTWPIVTEAFYLLNFSDRVQDNLWEFIQRGGVGLAPIESHMVVRCRELMQKYRDLPMDLADATLVALGEAMNLNQVFTLDHRDFHLYRPRHRKRFKLMPAKL